MVYKKCQPRRGRRLGFTLMEVLVVVAIILILAGLGGYYYLGQVNEARKSAAKVQARTLSQAAETYNLNHRGQWPPSLRALLGKDEFGGPYLKNQDALLDPWGQEYQYNPAGPENGGLQPDIWSESPYGRIGNWASKGITEP